ncbi:hypothetical protein [Neisseria sp. S1]|uniref:hypothetical protein n=1 Tax=Neisseria sp. S1 TaxID=3318354 RepID=UPI003A86FDCA
MIKEKLKAAAGIVAIVIFIAMLGTIYAMSKTIGGLKNKLSEQELVAQAARAAYAAEASRFAGYRAATEQLAEGIAAVNAKAAADREDLAGAIKSNQQWANQELPEEIKKAVKP